MTERLINGPSEYSHDPEKIMIEPNRRLISNGVAARSGLQEFFSPSLNSRVITVPTGSETARTHEDLMEMRLPVFSALYRENSLWLLVPDDARPVRGLLRFIARDLNNYSEIFYQIGQTLGQLDSTGVGLPETRQDKSVLNNFAFWLDEGEIYGGKVSLIPPYPLNPLKSRERTVGSIFLELSGAELFSETEATLLTDKVRRGWQDAIS